MSSILDALKKLEEDKDRAESQPEEIHIAPEIAERELVGESVLRDRFTLRLSPLVLVVSMLTVAVVLVAVSVGISILLVGKASEERPEEASAQGARKAVASVPETQQEVVSAPGVAQPTSKPEATPSPSRAQANEVAAKPAALSPKREAPREGRVVASAPTAVTPTPAPVLKEPASHAASTAPAPPTPMAAPALPAPRPNPAPQHGIQAKDGEIPKPIDPVDNSNRAVAPVHVEEAPKAIAAKEVAVTPKVVPPPPVVRIPESSPPAIQMPEAPPPTVVVPAAVAPADLNPEPSPPVRVARARESVAASTPTQRSERREMRPARRPSPSPVETPIRREARASRPAPLPASIRELPALGFSIRSRYGLEDLKVQMVSPAGETRPHGSAVISRMKVYEGERIQGMPARLVRVESYGIAIEITTTGDLYFVKF